MNNKEISKNVKTIKIFSGMLVLLAFTACSSNIDESADAPRFYNVTLTAFMGDADTRALSESGNVITATFAERDGFPAFHAHWKTRETGGTKE